MIDLIRLELRRIRRDKRFWFFALVGVPVLLPALVMMLAFAMASFGTVEPTKVRAQVATNVDSTELLEVLAAADLAYDSFASADDVRQALQAGSHAIGLIGVDLQPGRPMTATVLTASKTSDSLHQGIRETLRNFALSRRTELVESLDFDGPSFDLLLAPIELEQERVPDRLPPGLLQVVTLVWSALLLFPYLLLSWNASTRLVTDRLSGYLSPLTASALSPWHWLIARWSSLAIVAGALLVYSAILFSVYMRAYATFADWIVAQGVLEGLSGDAGRTAAAYFVHSVTIWRETSIVSLILWLFIAYLQLLSLAALIVWGSMRAPSLSSARLYELLPFIIVFLLPMLGLGALGYGIGWTAWVPGLGSVLSTEYMLTGNLPDARFVAAFGIALVSNAAIIVAFIALSRLALRNERLAFATI